MKYEEFRDLIQKKSGPRVHRATGSFGILQAYNLIKEQIKVDYKTFSYIIKSLNQHYISLLVDKGQDIKIPHGLGKITLAKYNVKPYKDGKLDPLSRVDWPATLKWWYEDEQARKEKKLLRRNVKNIYSVSWSKGRFNNRSYFIFRLMRGPKNRLSQNLREHKIDALLVNL